jgi:hypothetical protein
LAPKLLPSANDVADYFGLFSILHISQGLFYLHKQPWLVAFASLGTGASVEPSCSEGRRCRIYQTFLQLFSVQFTSFSQEKRKFAARENWKNKHMDDAHLRKHGSNQGVRSSAINLKSKKSPAITKNQGGG